MRANTIFIPGKFQDAFVYMDWLVAITDSGTAKFLSLRQILEQLNKLSPNSSLTNEFLFLHSDWMGRDVFHTFMSNTTIAREFASCMDAFPSPYLEIDASTIRQTETDLSIGDSFVLNMTIYYYRLYLASKSGLYHVDVDWKSETPKMFGRPKRRIDARCFNISVKYSLVAASCGEDGLFTVGEDLTDRTGPGRLMRRNMPESIKSEWLSYNIVNYSSRSDAELLINEYTKERSSRPNWRDSVRITNVGISRKDLGYLLEQTGRRHQFSPSDVRYLYNNRSAMLVQTRDRYIYLVGIKGVREGDLSQGYIKQYARINSMIVDSSLTPFGLLLESELSVLLFRKGRMYEISRDEVISARAFGAATRLRNIVALTQEDGIRLVGLFDDSQFGGQPKHGAAKIRELPRPPARARVS